MTTILLAVVAMMIFIALISVRMIFVKDGEFHGTCSSNNPYLQRENNGNCLVCGKSSDEPCPNGPELSLPDSETKKPNTRT